MARLVIILFLLAVVVYMWIFTATLQYFWAAFALAVATVALVGALIGHFMTKKVDSLSQG